MDIKRAGSQPSGKGPSDWFTGTVRIDPLFQTTAPARTAGASVTFEPGARTAWHTHPLGQTLIVTTGCGWAQRDGGPIEEIRPGDVIWFPPGGKTLAWGVTLNGYDAYRNSRSSGRQGRGLDGEGQRRAIQAVMSSVGFWTNATSAMSASLIGRATTNRGKKSVATAQWLQGGAQASP